MTMTLDDMPVVLGVQEPRLSSFSPGEGPGLGEECSVYAETFTLSLLDWQDDVLDMTMRTYEVISPLGIVTKKWANRDVCLVVSRQNGKGSILTARCLYGLYVLNERIIHTAHEFKTASDAYTRIKGYIKARPTLAVRTHFQNQYGLEKITVYKEKALVGEPTAVLQFLARSGGSGRGFAADLVICDEAYDLTEAQVRALLPTQITSENPQTWYTSSAVDEETQPNGMLLATIRRRGIACAPRLAFAEWSAEAGDDRELPATWAKANPSMCRLKGFDMQTILDLKAGFSRSGFDVEILSIGKWPEPISGETVVDMDMWKKLASSSVDVAGPMCVAIDMSSNRQWITISAAQYTAEYPARVRLEVGYHARTSDDAILYLGMLVDAWDPVIVMGRTSPAMALWPKLSKAGIEPETIQSTDVAAAAGGFVDDVGLGLISHAGDERVDDDLRGVQKKDLSGGAFGWDYRSPVTLSPLQSITLARYGLIKLTDEPRKPALPATGDDYRNDRSDEPYTDLGQDMDPLSAGF